MSRREKEAERLRRIVDILAGIEPAPRSYLDHKSPWQLLVATVLSAQCTDAGVNRVTPAFFSRYPGPAALARADAAEVENLIRSIGLYRNKARHLVALARIVAKDHGGQVPCTREALERLPGVGRKTASVVLGQGCGVPAFAVDTHVGRVCHRLGFAKSPDPREVEEAITPLLAPSRWVEAHLLLIRHGRSTCKARAPRCPECPVRQLCRWPQKSVARQPA